MRLDATTNPLVASICEVLGRDNPTRRSHIEIISRIPRQNESNSTTTSTEQEPEVLDQSQPLTPAPTTVPLVQQQPTIVREKYSTLSCCFGVFTCQSQDKEITFYGPPQQNMR